jgi:hypothetical protein
MIAIPTIAKEEPRRACSATNVGVPLATYVIQHESRPAEPTEHDVPLHDVRRLGHDGKCGRILSAGPAAVMPTPTPPKALLGRGDICTRT